MKPTNKTLLFCQYVGQQVICKDLSLTLQGISAADLGIEDSGGEILRMHRNTVILTGDWSGIGIEQTGTARIEDCMLQLRTIGDLTDGELFIIGNMCQSPLNGAEVAIGRDMCEAIGDIMPDRCYWGPKYIGAALDYLRSISIALPFTYLDANNHPVTLLVQEQVDLKWIVIK